MPTIRIIPCLDVDNGRVVKGIKFKDIIDAGNPVDLAKYYNEQNADEIIFLDIGATYKSRKTLIGIVEKVSQEVFVPLTVGGGIRTIQDIREMLRSGADKISICSSAIKNPSLIKEAADIFGSQCIVISIDAKKVGNSWNCFTSGGRCDSGINAIEWAKKAVSLGAGEILLNSIDSDGTKNGYDLELTKIVSKSVSVPVIASGGAGTLKHLLDAINLGKADAILLASILHYKEISIPEIKEFLKNNSIEIR